MQASRIPTGSKALDKFLHGGYETDIITTIYGPGGTGKTNLCMLCAATIARSGKKVIYIDTEGGFSLERLKQIAPDWKKILDNILILKPTSFSEQQKTFEKLKDLVTNKIGLIVVDTIAMLYRIALGHNDTFDINKELGVQISYLNEIARKKHIPVLITSQVYSRLEKDNKINIVGGDILKYSSKCLIELQKISGNKKRLFLRKHRSIAPKSMLFEIVYGGIIGSKSGKD